jgi:hypothetical protein
MNLHEFTESFDEPRTVCQKYDSSIRVFPSLNRIWKIVVNLHEFTGMRLFDSSIRVFPYKER